ncbi:MAG: hypothetical protein M3N33_06015 [Actinomycetota bacterium]|nr:hypothetical protein [Actinomycetota bacterium]
MLREVILRARSALLLLFVFALVACGGGSQPPEGGSGEGRSSERQDSGAGQAEKRAEKGAGQDTTTARMETTGPDEGTVAEEAKSGSKNNRRSGPVPSDALAAGATDSTGGPLARGRIVSYYGHPLSGAMGALGQLEPKVMVRELKEQTQAYTKADPDRPAIPTIELIASVAQPTPGPDGLYLAPTEDFWIEKYAKLAEENDCLLLLDIQIGYSTIAAEVERLMPYLERDYVHLAIDTEYDMIPPDIPGQQIGSSPGRTSWRRRARSRDS